MTAILLNELLDIDVIAGAKARPRYSTDIITTDGGFEIRNSRWSYPLFQFEFDVMPGFREGDEAIDAFINTFHVVGGAFGVFRFNYWRDGPVTNQTIGTGDGSTTQFQLYRSYSRESISRNRKITRPIAGTVTIYVNGVSAPFTLDDETGIVTMNAAPGNGLRVSADFEHDVPVRFADDEIELVGLTDMLDQPVSIVLMEVRE